MRKIGLTESNNGTSSDYAVECQNLSRVYTARSLMGKRSQVKALDDLSINIPKGIVFGLLGPNGAGKTTTVRILTTLLTPTAGTARVLGYDVVKQASQVRKSIGFILGGDRGFYGRLTGRQNVRYAGALNHMDPKLADRRTSELLEQFGLGEDGDTLVERYSRGMKQRLHIARGLLTDPEVIFMDEPTMGLDPIGAQELRQYIPELVSDGKTILLTTHYMMEADMLCDTIAMINKGSLVAQGTPTEIKRHFSPITIVEIVLKNTRAGIVDEVKAVEGVERADQSTQEIYQKITVHVKAGYEVRGRVETIVGNDNIESIVARDPTLEEAYVSILG